MNEIIKGKVKTVFETDEPGCVRITYYDRVTAGNGEKECNPPNKGPINCQISSLIFEELERRGIKTHHIKTISSDSMLCKRVTIYPVEVVVRNYAAGSIVRQTPFEKGKKFDEPLVEFYLKDDSKNDPLLNEPRLKLLGYPYQIFIDKALEINKELIRIFALINLNLVDFKLEFGFTSNGDIILADEVTPDGCRLWKQGTQESMDKDLFRNETGDLIEAYKKILLDLQGVL